MFFFVYLRYIYTNSYACNDVILQQDIGATATDIESWITDSSDSPTNLEIDNGELDNGEATNVLNDDQTTYDSSKNAVANIHNLGKIRVSILIALYTVLIKLYCNNTNTNTEIFTDEDKDSYNSVTCFCGKPYATRPMIECSTCLTWLHFSCAKINRKQIPETFICKKCTLKALRDNESAFEKDSSERATKRSRFRHS